MVGLNMLVELLYSSVAVAPQLTVLDLDEILLSAHRSFSEWSMGFVSAKEIDSLMPLSISEIVRNMLTEEAKNQPLSLGVNGFISIYNQMRKFPYR